MEIAKVVTMIKLKRIRRRRMVNRKGKLLEGSPA